MTYNDDNTTEFKETANNNKKETYTFDNYGNTVTVLNANGMITNASDSGSLGISTGSDSYTKNYMDITHEPESGDFVKVSGNKIKVTAKKAGKAVITVTTKAKNANGKKLSKKLTLTVKKAKSYVKAIGVESEDTINIS